MSTGSEFMQTVGPSNWEHGYLFVDGSDRKARGAHGYIRCELYLKIGTIAAAQIFFQISEICPPSRTYQLFISQDEAGVKQLLFADVGYVGQHSKTNDITVPTPVDARIDPIAEAIVRMLHPLIWERFICLRPPDANLWYLCLSETTVGEMEYYSGIELVPFVFAIQTALSSS